MYVKNTISMHSINYSNTQVNYKKETIPPLICVNWHLWPHCNYNCSFCFAKSLQKIIPVPKKVAISIPALLAKYGAKKITFTGGEPFLCSYLPEIINSAKRSNLTTMVVSNGSVISNEVLEVLSDSLDWLGLSIDSNNEVLNQKLGRGKGNHIYSAIHAADLANELGIKVKLNTVVSSFTWNDDLSLILEVVKPTRWKILQVLHIRGENDDNFTELQVTPAQFQTFVSRHAKFNPIVEDMETMRGSYIMLDPQCRFFQNSTGRLQFSQSILDVGVISAINEVGWDYNKFLSRGGVYEW